MRRGQGGGRRQVSAAGGWQRDGGRDHGDGGFGRGEGGREGGGCGSAGGCGRPAGSRGGPSRAERSRAGRAAGTGGLPSPGTACGGGWGEVGDSVGHRLVNGEERRELGGESPGDLRGEGKPLHEAEEEEEEGGRSGHLPGAGGGGSSEPSRGGGRGRGCAVLGTGSSGRGGAGRGPQAGLCGGCERERPVRSAGSAPGTAALRRRRPAGLPPSGASARPPGTWAHRARPPPCTGL